MTATYRDTPSAIPLSLALTRKTRRMARSNAGIKRNRQRADTLVTRREIRLTATTEAAYTAAATASGNVSLSLYLERLCQALEAEGHALPILDHADTRTEVRSTNAA